MYQPYPSSGRDPMPSQPPRPRSVDNAVKFMYLGAALSAIGFIIGLTTVGSLRSAIERANHSLTTSQVHTAVVFGVAVLVITGLIGVGLWLWMAWANGKGRAWARIVASVLFGLNTIGLLLAVVRPHASITLLFTILIWLAGLGAIILLWMQDASEYFQAASMPR